MGRTFDRGCNKNDVNCVLYSLSNRYLLFSLAWPSLRRVKIETESHCSRPVDFNLYSEMLQYDRQSSLYNVPVIEKGSIKITTRCIQSLYTEGCSVASIFHYFKMYMYVLIFFKNFFYKCSEYNIETYFIIFRNRSTEIVYNNCILYL